MNPTDTTRAEFKRRRDYGLKQRHQQRLERVTRCRMLDRLGNRCPNQALDTDAPLVLCIRHTAAAVELIRDLADTAPDLLTTKETRT